MYFQCFVSDVTFIKTVIIFLLISNLQVITDFCSSIFDMSF